MAEEVTPLGCPPSSSTSSAWEAECWSRGPGILTGQKAEPVGLKFTLFLSGQEKRGVVEDCLDLKERGF